MKVSTLKKAIDKGLDLLITYNGCRRKIIPRRLWKNSNGKMRLTGIEISKKITNTCGYKCYDITKMKDAEIAI